MDMSTSPSTRNSLLAQSWDLRTSRSPSRDFQVKPVAVGSTCRLVAGTLLLGLCGWLGLALHAIPYLTYFYKDLIVDSTKHEVFTYVTNWTQFGFTIQSDVTAWFFIPLAVCIFAGLGIWRTAVVALVTAAATGCCCAFVWVCPSFSLLPGLSCSCLGFLIVTFQGGWAVALFTIAAFFPVNYRLLVRRGCSCSALLHGGIEGCPLGTRFFVIQHGLRVLVAGSV